ncbi:uncharacterized protein VTP21DRAFT_2855 [Calcarisporiella thermophila]|uniref:uncharacterized protein n=1 Tax=Calcarisporiella thermophila TaxID=911321 RepID=UPI0037425DFF
MEICVRGGLIYKKEMPYRNDRLQSMIESYGKSCKSRLPPEKTSRRDVTNLCTALGRVPKHKKEYNINLRCRCELSRPPQQIGFPPWLGLYRAGDFTRARPGRGPSRAPDLRIWPAEKLRKFSAESEKKRALSWGLEKTRSYAPQARRGEWRTSEASVHNVVLRTLPLVSARFLPDPPRSELRPKNRREISDFTQRVLLPPQPLPLLMSSGTIALRRRSSPSISPPSSFS